MIFFVGSYAASNMFLLACVAINGFYPITSYEWLTTRPQGPRLEGKTALLYTDTFTCRVKGVNKTILGEVQFHTKGQLIYFYDCKMLAYIY